jgi:hypothetical protein
MDYIESLSIQYIQNAIGRYAGILPRKRMKFYRLGRFKVHHRTELDHLNFLQKNWLPLREVF